VFDLVRHAIDAARRPDTEVVVQPARRGAPSTRLYAMDWTNLLTAAEMVDALQGAEREGFDGAVIGQSLDPGLFVAKELLNVPVVGILEAATHFAALWGERFGVVTIPMPEGYPQAKYYANHQRNIARYGLDGKLAAMDTLAMPLETLTARIQAGQHDEILTRFDEAAQRCVARGADVVIAGDTIISVVLVKEQVLSPGSYVVVDLVSSGVKMAECLVDLRRAFGVVRSRAGVYASPSAEDRAAVRDAFGVGG
ncbi:MAG: aspartate/glutamate racemase family protein, partial [Dehalococcoidia bacterium]|nr:aspartate/glutamate racemase family protein [Dehalococcoidia bacterium]